MYQIREANQMIEEFMLAANVSVAEKILKHFPLCSLLRFVNESILFSINFLIFYLSELITCLSSTLIWSFLFKIENEV